mmetsp:Transcript_131975/g.186280  ORF Transcript_131975/g.186280 Transcript_131975/m.186280 type:complete len:206 (-) Transcript_131975:196-813(-)
MLWNCNGVSICLQVYQESRIRSRRVPDFDHIRSLDQSLQFCDRHSVLNSPLLLRHLSGVVFLILAVLSFLQKRCLRLCPPFWLLLVLVCLFLVLRLHILEPFHDRRECFIFRLIISSKNFWYHVIHLHFIVVFCAAGTWSAARHGHFALRTSLGTFSTLALGRQTRGFQLFGFCSLFLLLQLLLFVLLPFSLSCFLFSSFLLGRI